jgi:hypothetical protein
MIFIRQLLAGQRRVSPLPAGISGFAADDPAM